MTETQALKDIENMDVSDDVRAILRLRFKIGLCEGATVKDAYAKALMHYVKFAGGNSGGNDA